MHAYMYFWPPCCASTFLPFSLVGQDIRLSPERPGFESLRGNIHFFSRAALRVPEYFKNGFKAAQEAVWAAAKKAAGAASP